jgi:hypothetical protein
MNRLSGFPLDTSQPAPLEYLVGPDEAAEFLHLDIHIVLFWASINLLPAHPLRYNGQTAWRFKLSELAWWVEQNRSDASPKGLKKLANGAHKASSTRKGPRAAKPNAARNKNIS